jgi:transposase
MPEIFYVQRGNRKYAYTSTSVYQPGNKYPKTVNEYLGVLDESTGKIIPKKKMVPNEKLSGGDDLKGRRFGGSYLIMNVAEDIGLREDLFGSFGLEGDKILACAAAQALSGGPLSSAEDTVDGCMIRELLGIGGSFSSPRMSEFTKRLGDSYADLETLFEKRLARTDGALSYDLTSASSHSRMEEWAEWGHNRDNEKMRQMNIGLITDKTGIPAMFEVYPGSVADMKTLERTAERVKELKKGTCTMVMDRGFGSASNLKYMTEKDLSFVIPGKKGTKCVKTLMSMLAKEKQNPDLLMMHDDISYSVMGSQIAIAKKGKQNGPEDEESNDTAEYELILPDDPRFADIPESMRMTAYACYDLRKAADERNRLQIALGDIEMKLSKMDPKDAVYGLKRIAGPYAKYLDVSEAEGKLVIERRRNALSFSMNRDGMFVMFSRGIDSWEDMMSCYDGRMYVEQAFDALKNELDGNRWRTPDPMTAKGRLILKFVALIIWCTIAKMLRNMKNKEPVRTALQSMDNILAVGCKEEWRVLEITKRNRNLMENLGIPIPDTKLTLKDRQYIPKAVAEEVRKEL